MSLAEAAAAEQKHPSHICLTQCPASLDRSSDFSSLEDAWDCLELGRRQFALRKYSNPDTVLGDLGLERHTQTRASKPSEMSQGQDTGQGKGDERTNEPRLHSSPKDLLTRSKSDNSPQNGIQFTSHLQNTSSVVLYELTF